jgi:hypothetical protein
MVAVGAKQRFLRVEGEFEGTSMKKAEAQDIAFRWTALCSMVATAAAITIVVWLFVSAVAYVTSSSSLARQILQW